MRIHSGLGVSESTRKPNILTRLMSEEVLFAQPEESIYQADIGSLLNESWRFAGTKKAQYGSWPFCSSRMPFSSDESSTQAKTKNADAK